MSITLAFDVYGTLINTHGLVEHLESLIGGRAGSFSQAWRDKQLEYSFRRGLMNQYQPFSECTRSALEYACHLHQLTLSAEQKAELLRMYATLPAFEDTKSIAELDSAIFDCFAFSNGTEAAVRGLINHAGIESYIKDVVSVDDIKTFKPNPATYAYFMERSKGAVDRTWLISSNPFDVIGARSFGLQAAWVKRSPAAVFDDWEFEPTVIVSTLDELTEKIQGFYQ